MQNKIPSTEDVKRWHQLLVGIGEKEMNEDILSFFDSDKLKKALGLLEKYEALEAEIIVSDECWEPQGMAETPRFTQDQWDKIIELQSERNEILGRFK